MHFSSTKSLFSTVAHVTDKLPGLERDELEFLKEKKFIVQEPDHYVPASERSMDHFIDLPLDQDYISEALRKLEADYRIPNLHQKEFIDQMRMDVWTRLICAHIERGTHHSSLPAANSRKSIAQQERPTSDFKYRAAILARSRRYFCLARHPRFQRGIMEQAMDVSTFPA